MYLLLAFLAVPLIEIALFVQIGGTIGLWPTLAIVIATAVLGSTMMRAQGRVALSRLQASLSQLDDPTRPIADGAMILLAGALLLTPGFFTDALGFALLIPGVRAAVFWFLAARVQVNQFQMGQFRTGPGPGAPRPGSDGSGDIVEGEYEEVHPTRDPGARPSGWVEGPKRH
jgi:UPF0716 protein FxsA